MEFAEWVRVEKSDGLCQSDMPGPGPVWAARASPDVPGPLGCQGKSGVPGSVWGARAITGVPKRV